MGMSLANQPGTFEYEHRTQNEKLIQLKNNLDAYLATLRSAAEIPSSAMQELMKFEVFLFLPC